MYTSKDDQEACQSIFGHSDNLKYLTIFNFENESLNREPETGDITGENVKQWMSSMQQFVKTENFLEGLIVVFSSCYEACETGHKFQSLMQMRKTTYTSLSKLLHWPHQFLRMTTEDFMGIHTSIGTKPEQLSHFCLQSPTLRSPFSVGISYDPSLCLTTVIIHRPANHTFTELAEYLTEHREQISVPLLVGVYFLDRVAHDAADRIVQDRKAQLDIESRTGTRPKYYFDSRCCAGRIISNKGRSEATAEKELEFTEFTEKLTALRSALRFKVYHLDEFILTLEKMNDCIERLKPRREEAQERYSCAAECIQGEYIPFLTTSMKSTRRRGQYMVGRCKIQAQTVYNGVLRQLSEETKKEGATMKRLVTIATVFLPATFMASFFAMSFFDFQRGHADPSVSPWIWLYFLSTAVLTTVIWLSIQWGNEKKKTHLEVLDSLRADIAEKRVLEV